ncbi:MAG: DUF3887 domain-containing protein [Clostridia bacterium]
MKRAIIMSLILLILFSGCNPEAVEKDIEQYDGTMKEIAEHFVNDFVSKDVDSILEKYNYTLQVEQALNRMMFIQVYSQIENVNGEFTEIGERTESNSLESSIITYQLIYTEGSIKLNIVFDNEKKIAGFNYVQEKEKVEYSESIVSEEVEFGSEEYPITGTITYPNQEDSFYAVILIPGSGPTDRDSTLYENTPMKDLALGLADKGIASLRFDKRNLLYGDKIDINSFTPYQEYIADVKFAYDLMVNNERIDNEHIYLIGHSQGGNLIPAFAKEVEAAGFVILSGNVTPLHELTIDQLEYLYNLDGELSDKEKQDLEGYKKMRDNINNLDESSDFTPQQLMGVSKDYWLFYKKYDPIEQAKEIKEQVLIVNGSRDYQVPVSEYELWKNGLSNRENVTFKLYEGMNHLLFNGEGTPSPQEYLTAKNISQELVNDIYNWIINKN